VETVLRARRARPITAAISLSAGNGASAASHPCWIASARSAATFGRPITRARAMSRSESPWRKRTRTVRYWNISILLRATSLLPEKIGERSGSARQFEMSVIPTTGSHMPISDWLHYGDHQVVPICRSRTGSYMPVTKWLQYADR
jgi:hypothetical protein